MKKAILLGLLVACGAYSSNLVYGFHNALTITNGSVKGPLAETMPITSSSSLQSGAVYVAETIPISSSITLDKGI